MRTLKYYNYFYCNYSSHINATNSFQISWHAVSRAVGNVRNKGSEIAKKVELDKSGKAVKREADTMAKWLIKKPKQEDKIKKEEPDEDWIGHKSPMAD